MEIETRIRQVRQRLGYSQEYVAIQLDISTKTYRNMEDGKSKLYLSRLKRLSQVLNIDISELIRTDLGYKKDEDAEKIPKNKQMYFFDDKIIELYDRLLSEKDKYIRLLESKTSRITTKI